jgi:hypothetical protein
LLPTCAEAAKLGFNLGGRSMTDDVLLNAPNKIKLLEPELSSYVLPKRTGLNSKHIGLAR